MRGNKQLLCLALVNVGRHNTHQEGNRRCLDLDTMVHVPQRLRRTCRVFKADRLDVGLHAPTLKRGSGRIKVDPLLDNFGSCAAHFTQILSNIDRILDEGSLWAGRWQVPRSSSVEEEKDLHLELHTSASPPWHGTTECRLHRTRAPVFLPWPLQYRGGQAACLFCFSSLP